MFESMFTRTIPQIRTVVLTPKSKSYGSSEVAKLEEVRSDLAEFHDTNQELSAVIVDLSGVDYHGAAFLAILSQFAKRLRSKHVELIVSGDRTGLFELAGVQAWCRLAEDLVEALGKVVIEHLLRDLESSSVVAAHIDSFSADGVRHDSGASKELRHSTHLPADRHHFVAAGTCNR